ncbi:O-antigen ligase family protein, partial [Candidatus Nomurabacteria bacterium]|nr:O-antigen ligase family protein [Candidatus Nomurabacteria bacterium]
TYLFCFILFISSLFVFNKESLYSPLKALALGGVISSISVYLSPALFNLNLYFLNNSNNAGTFGNTTYAGLFLVFSIFSALILFFKEKDKIKKAPLWLLCTLIIFLCPIFLNTKGIFTGNLSGLLSFIGEARAGFVSIVLGLLIALILYLYFDKRKTFSFVAKVSLVLTIFGSMWLTYGLFNNESRFHNLVVKSGEESRFIYWRMSTISIGQNPVMGIGLENFPSIYQKYFDPILLSPGYPDGAWTDKPHNNILEIAYSGGLVGLMFYLSLVGFILISLIQKVRTSESIERATGALLFGLLTAYFFQLFFAFDTISSLPTFFITIALVSVFCFGEPKLTEKRYINKYLKIFFVVFFIILTFLMIYFFSWKVGQESKMLRKMNSIPVEERISVFKNTITKSGAVGIATESQYIDLVVAKYKSNWSTYSLEIRAKVKKELEYLFEYSKQRSEEYPSDFRMALMSARIGNMLFDISKVKQLEFLEVSKKYGARAVSNSPLNDMGYLTLAETFILEGDLDRAMKFAEMAVNLNPIVPKFHNLVIYIARLKNSQRLIDEKIKEAKKYIPNYEYLVK